MKLVIVLGILALVGLAVSETNVYPRGCSYVNGKCYKACEEGTHAYSTGCGYLTPEATCENPNPVEDKRGKICDYSACHCDPPTVRDTVTKKCIPVEQCPKKNDC